MKKKLGFTLVELLAVISILAILVIISLPNVMGMFNDAKKKSFATECKRIFKVAEQTFMNDSLYEQKETVYAKCDGCTHKQLDLSGRQNIKYYIKFNKGGKVVEYYVSDGDYQYMYNGDGLLVENIDGIQSTVDVGEDNVLVISDSGIPSKPIPEGSYVTYGGRLFAVLYNIESTYGWTEIISVNPVESITLGGKDNTTGATGTYDSYLRAKWSYNNAVTTLNNASLRYLDSSLADRARCVGTDPTNPSDTASIHNYDKVRATDSNFNADYNKLRSLSLSGFNDTNYTYYWLASRACGGDSSNHCCINCPFGLRRVNTTGGKNDTFYSSSTLGYIIVTNEVDYESMDEQDREGYDFYYYTNQAGLRPIIRLKPEVHVISGEGTTSSPYQLGI